jgi:hypothetical protein
MRCLRSRYLRAVSDAVLRAHAKGKGAADSGNMGRGGAIRER